VPDELFAEMPNQRLVEEVEPGQWAMTEKARRRLKGPPSMD
jgi:hypothetical protein